VFKAFKTF